MMLNKANLQSIITKILTEFSLEVYDLEFFPAKSKTLQVFICKQERDAKNGFSVGVDDCVKVHKTLQRHPELESFFTNFALEVSSPGIERKLKKPEHFLAAIGERIKVVLKFGPHQGNALCGELQSFENNSGVILDENSQEALDFVYADIKSAKVAPKL